MIIDYKSPGTFEETRFEKIHTVIFDESKEASKMVANEIGFNGKPLHLSGRPKEVRFATCSANKSRKLLNYKTKTSLKEAIKKTTEFIKKNGTKPFKYYLPVEIINDKTPEAWVKKLI